jgi:hypothetical protein
VEEFRTQNSVSSNFAGLFHNAHASGIPFGTYRLKVGLSGFYPITRTALVSQSNALVVVSLSVGDIIDCAGPCREGGINGSHFIKGNVGGLGNNRAFARLLGVFSSENAKSNITSRGDFEFHRLFTGPDVLIVYDTKTAWVMTDVNVTRTNPPVQLSIGTESVRSLVALKKKDRKERYTVSGKLDGSFNPATSFLKLAEIWGPLSIETSVDSDGKFEFAGVSPGPYLFVKVRDGKLAGTSVVNIPTD